MLTGFPLPPYVRFVRLTFPDNQLVRKRKLYLLRKEIAAIAVHYEKLFNLRYR